MVSLGERRHARHRKQVLCALAVTRGDLGHERHIVNHPFAFTVEDHGTMPERRPRNCKVKAGNSSASGTMIRFRQPVAFASFGSHNNMIRKQFVTS